MRQTLFEIYLTAEGPKTETKMEKRMLLRTLAAYCEDLREEIYVERLKQEVPRVQIADVRNPIGGHG